MNLMMVTMITAAVCCITVAVNPDCTRCTEWYNKERQDITWLTELNSQFPCPCVTKKTSSSHVPKDQPAAEWKADISCSVDGKASWGFNWMLGGCYYHHGADGCLRSVNVTESGAGQQCCYNSAGRLLLSHESGSGTPDKSTNLFKLWKPTHISEDVDTYKWCCISCPELCSYYMEVRKQDDSHCRV